MTFGPTPRTMPPPGREPLPERVGETGKDLLSAIQPALYAESETDAALHNLAGAWSQLLDPVAYIVRDDADGNLGWTLIASPRRCPTAWLRVLAQWAGIRRWDALTDEQLRDLIEDAPGLWRGTRRAMIAAVRRFFPEGFEASRFLFFQERADGDAYKLRVFTYSFVEPLDSDAVREALELAKPAGLRPFIYEVRVGQTYEMLNRRRESYADAKEHYEDYHAVLHDEPLDMP